MWAYYWLVFLLNKKLHLYNSTYFMGYNVNSHCFELSLQKFAIFSSRKCIRSTRKIYCSCQEIICNAILINESKNIMELDLQSYFFIFFCAILYARHRQTHSIKQLMCKKLKRIWKTVSNLCPSKLRVCITKMYHESYECICLQIYVNIVIVDARYW